MSAMPGVSIVIPNYNYAQFVGEAIDCALAQTHPEVEVIVVDDGSSDDSRAVIESYGDRIKTVFKENGGHASGCAAGFRVSRHPILIFCDSDDRLVPEAAVMAAADWPERVSKKQFSLRTLKGKDELLDHVWPKYTLDLTPEAMRRELLRTGYYPCPPTSGNAFSRRFLEQIAPFGGHTYFDALANTLAPLYGDVVTHEQVFAHYRLHGSNNYSSNRIVAQRFQNYIVDDQRRVACLEAHCRRLGIDFEGAGVLRKLLPYCEFEVIAAKLSATSLKDQRRVLELAWQAVAAGMSYPQSPWHRMVRAAWISAIALLPRPLADPVIGLRYVSADRPRAIETLINCFGRRSVAG